MNQAVKIASKPHCAFDPFEENAFKIKDTKPDKERIQDLLLQVMWLHTKVKKHTEKKSLGLVKLPEGQHLRMERDWFVHVQNIADKFTTGTSLTSEDQYNLETITKNVVNAF